MDNKSITGTPDSKLINMNEGYEVQYWTKELNVSKDTLQVAIDAVGSSVAKVREYLGK